MDGMKPVAPCCYPCECHDTSLGWQIQRLSNNSEPGFTVVEVLAVHLFAFMEEAKRQISQIHHFACIYLRGWFPSLPTCGVYLLRINRLADCLPLYRSSGAGPISPPDSVVSHTSDGLKADLYAMVCYVNAARLSS